MDFRAVYLGMKWDEVPEEWEVADLVLGLKEYVESDDPIYPIRDRHSRALHRFLFRKKPDPTGLAPLFGPHGEKKEVTGQLIKRDNVGYAVITSLIRRLFVNARDRHRKEIYDVVAGAAVHFSFEPIYGDAYTRTGAEASDFFSEPTFPACAESRASLEKVFPELLAKWRGRVTDRASSTFFGVVIRHLGADGLQQLCGEWKGMNEEERYDLLKRIADLESVGREARVLMVESLVDASLDVRAAGAEGLEAHGAPVGDLDPTGRDEDIRKALGPLRRWAAKTKP